MARKMPIITFRFHRRHFVLAALLAALAGCGSGGTQNTPAASGYSIGGTVSGLNGTLVLQDDGADNLSVSTNGAFKFPTTLGLGISYSVTIASQPTASTCVISNGAGTVQGVVSSVTVLCSASASSGQWTWEAGADTIDSGGEYGHAGTASAANLPGAREAPVSWTDSTGRFWLFGGYGYDANGAFGLLNDLWQYDPNGGQWTWFTGSSVVGATSSYGTQGVPTSSNVPGARAAAASWTDAAGRLWLFGGLSTDTSQNPVDFNDLWQYQPTTGQWTWVGGSNTAGTSGNYGTQGVASPTNLPPPRAYPVTWVDSAGTLWLFGGAQYGSSGITALFNDLWNYSPTSNQWTWISGSSVPNAAGSYGTQGTASGSNVPGARSAASAWRDAAGDLWLLGGYGLDQAGQSGELNDLWRFDPNAGQWTWMGGATTVDVGGVYGTQGTAAAANAPGARLSASAWTDATGNFWLFGGYGYNQVGNLNNLSDLWEYSPVTGQWTWVAGSTLTATTGNYGTQGTSTPGSLPGAREQAASWLDGQGRLWLFGGYGFDSLGEQGDLSDLWRFAY